MATIYNLQQHENLETYKKGEMDKAAVAPAPPTSTHSTLRRQNQWQGRIDGQQ